VLAGGLARVAATPGSTLVSNVAGALAKDVWVLSPRTAPAGRGRVDLAPAGDLTLAGDLLPAGSGGEPFGPPIGAPASSAPSSRAAEDLFWLGRYAERAEDTVRLLRVVDDLAEDWTARPDTAGHQSLQRVLRAVTHVTTSYPGFVGIGSAARLAAPHGELMSLVVDPDRPGTVAHAVSRTVQAAHAVRDQLSLDTWVVLGSLDRALDELAHDAAAGTDRPLRPALARMLESLLALAGLGAESMVRDIGWHYFDAGRRLERAIQLVALMQHTLSRPHPPGAQSLLLEAVLSAGESLITHRRRYQGRAQVRSVLELLLTDRQNPRAVAHQLDRLAVILRRLPPEPPGVLVGASLRDRLATVVAGVREVDPDSVGTLYPALGAVHLALTDLAQALAQAHFAPASPHRAIAGTPGWDT